MWCIIRDAENHKILHHRIEHYELFDELRPGRYRIKVQVPALWLTPGAYSLRFKVVAPMLGAKGRCVSDPVIIDFRSSDEMFVELASLEAILSPPVKWSVESVSHHVYDPQKPS